MIRSVVPHELDGQADIDFAPTGLKATFTVPSRFLHFDKENTDKSARAPQTTAPVMPSSGVLQEAIIVEDSLVIALDMQKKLKRMHIESVSIAGSLETARQSFERRTPELALFDVHLGRETTFELIEEVRRNGVPVIIISGYGEDLILPDTLRDIPVLTKPVSDSALTEALVELLK